MPVNNFAALNKLRTELLATKGNLQIWDPRVRNLHSWVEQGFDNLSLGISSPPDKLDFTNLGLHQLFNHFKPTGTNKIYTYFHKLRTTDFASIPDTSPPNARRIVVALMVGYLIVQYKVYRLYKELGGTNPVVFTARDSSAISTFLIKVESLPVSDPSLLEADPDLLPYLITMLIQLKST